MSNERPRPDAIAGGPQTFAVGDSVEYLPWNSSDTMTTGRITRIASGRVYVQLDSHRHARGHHRCSTRCDVWFDANEVDRLRCPKATP